MAKKATTPKVPKPKAPKVAKPKKEAAPKKVDLWMEVFNNFWNKKEFKKYSNYDRSKTFFMINRRMCIAHPREAAMVSKVGIDTGRIIQWWQLYASMLYPNKPGWTYEKSLKRTTTAKEYVPNKETVLTYCKWYDCTSKDVEEALKFFPKEIREELEEIENMYKKEKE